jgi:hypothetical protein
MNAATSMFHGFIYFAPEATEAYTAAGLTPEQHYFASRSAPFGEASAELVMATFFNFAPRQVHAAVPGAWANASPAAVQQARWSAARQRVAAGAELVEPAQIGEALELATTAVDALGYAARPLAAANAALELPDDELTALWQQIAVLREWRGDAHISALSAAGVGPLDCLILHGATGQVPPEGLRTTRGYTPEEWHAGTESLVARGLCESDGSFTSTGESLRAGIEATTDALSATTWEPIGVEGADRLRGILRSMTSAIWDGIRMPGR